VNQKRKEREKRCRESAVTANHANTETMLPVTPYISGYTSHTFIFFPAATGSRENKPERRLHVALTRMLLNLESPSHQIQTVAVYTCSVAGVVTPFVAAPVAMEFLP
jgi:hypothetical protein